METACLVVFIAVIIVLPATLACILVCKLLESVSSCIALDSEELTKEEGYYDEQDDLEGERLLIGLKMAKREKTKLSLPEIYWAGYQNAVEGLYSPCPYPNNPVAKEYWDNGVRDGENSLDYD